jgi:atypical dual specificity phosphatase
LKEILLMQNFYWLIDGELAGCGRPGQRDHMARPDGSGASPTGEPEALEADLEWLRSRGIGALLSLTETPLPEEMLAHHELAALHIPVSDLTAPTPEQLEQALGFIDRQRALGRAVAVHCLVGEGRTGTVLAAYLIRAGRTPDEALRELRVMRPNAVGAVEQQRALRAYAERRDWIV